MQHIFLCFLYIFIKFVCKSVSLLTYFSIFNSYVQFFRVFFLSKLNIDIGTIRWAFLLYKGDHEPASDKGADDSRSPIQEWSHLFYPVQLLTNYLILIYLYMYIFCIPARKFERSFFTPKISNYCLQFSRQKLGPPNVIMCQQFKIFVTEYHVCFNTLEVTKIYP